MVKEITSVKLTLTKDAGNIVAAVADVELRLGQQGSIKICGVRVMAPEGKPTWVSMPARQGKSAWFDVVTLRGPIKRLVETAVLQEFEHEHAKKTPTKE